MLGPAPAPPGQASTGHMTSTREKIYNKIASAQNWREYDK